MLKNGTFQPDTDLGANLNAALDELEAVARETPRTQASHETIELARRLGQWSELAWSIDLDDLRADRDTPEASRHGATAAGLVAADNGNRALSYLSAITGPNVYGQKLAQTTDPETLQGLHTVLHAGGLDRSADGRPLRPGQWRTTPGGVLDARTDRVHPAPEPEALPGIMRQWSDTFRWDAWSAVHPAVYAAQAYASLIAARPFEGGNGRVARMVAEKIMHDHGYPAIGLSAVQERYRAPVRARLYDAVATDDVEGWTRAFIALATEGTDTVNRLLPQLRRDLDKLVDHVGQVPESVQRSRHEIAVSMMANPIDRPIVFAQRHGLDREQTTELLRPLGRAGLVELGRINGKQLVITYPALENLHELARPRPARRQGITRVSLKAAGARHGSPRSP
jgi:Fic family protein